uniref:tRNA pseudouridine(13) synthase TruD n=1 Tax=Fervidicoccus fontis TaxID=683846 RepID=A0A7J3ZJF4_9CREN
MNYYEKIGISEFSFGPLSLSSKSFMSECRDFIVLERPFRLWTSEREGRIAVYVMAKEGVSTLEAIRDVAERLRARNVGCAGLKDANALAIQYISVEAESLPEYAGFPWGFLRRVGFASSHVRRGQIIENSFIIRIKGASWSELNRLKAALAGSCTWIYNYFGPQRFGISEPLNHELGLMILKRDLERLLRALEGKKPRGWWERAVLRARGFKDLFKRELRRVMELLVSSYQSYVFNYCLSVVAREGPTSLSEKPYGVVPGVGLSRIDTSKSWINREHADCALSALRSDGVKEESFKLPGVTARLHLRPLRVRVKDCRFSYSSSLGVVALFFTLPPGSYASIVLRELFGQDTSWLSRKCRRAVFKDHL